MPVILFNSTHHALEAEHLLDGEGYDIDIVSPPEKLQAECGLAIEISGKDRPAIKNMLVKAGIRFKEIVD